MPKTPTDETTTIAEELAAQQPMILETLNGLYDDATLLVGRILCDRRERHRGHGRVGDPRRLELRLTDADGEHAGTVPLPGAARPTSTSCSSCSSPW